MSSTLSLAQLQEQRAQLMAQLMQSLGPQQQTPFAAVPVQTVAARPVTAAVASSSSAAAASSAPAPSVTAAAGSKADAVLSYIAKNRNKGTADKYNSSWSMFERYLERIGKTDKTLDEWDIADYLRMRVDEHGVAASTMAGDRSAISDHLKHTPLKEKSNAQVVTDMMAVLRTKAAVSQPKQHMSAELMRELVLAHDARGPTGNANEWLRERNVFLMLFMMLAFLRQSEAVAMLVEDVEVKLLMVGGKAQKVMHIFIAKSKTDQARMGHVTLLGAAAETPFCPIARLDRYLQALRKAGFGGEKTPLFPTVNGSPMSTSTPCGIVQRAVREANEAAEQLGYGEQRWGDPDDYGSHSMRRGGVTTARANGASMLDIQKHGRWKSLTVFSYVGTTPQEQLAVTHCFLSSGAQKVQMEPAAAPAAPAAAAAGRGAALGDELPSPDAHALRAGSASKKKSSHRGEKRGRAAKSEDDDAEAAACAAAAAAEAEGDDDDESDSEEAKLREAEEDGMFDDALSEGEPKAEPKGKRSRGAAAASAKAKKKPAGKAVVQAKGGEKKKKKSVR